MDVERRAWTQPELVKVLSLYCQIPFGRMHRGNPAVKALAGAIGRTPSAVAYKLSNFASLDPELRRRGVRGLVNIGEADRQVWEEFCGRWEVLARQEEAVNALVLVGSRAKASGREKQRRPGPTEVARIARQRLGQDFFRAAVLAAYDGRCCVTGIGCADLLRASHIVPWSVDPAKRLDPRNGLCLNALHDAAFDRGLITFSEGLELRLSRRLKREVPARVLEDMFERHEGARITMPDRFQPAPESLAYHRRTVFVA